MWGPPEFPSYVVRTVHALRKKPIGEFTVEDLRIMVGQQASPQWLVPLAIEAVEAEPMACGDFYAGDLLVALLRVSRRYWESAPELRTRLDAVLAGLDELTPEIQSALDAGPRDLG